MAEPSAVNEKSRSKKAPTGIGVFQIRPSSRYSAQASVGGAKKRRNGGAIRWQL
jgi:hypothetical protein